MGKTPDDYATLQTIFTKWWRNLNQIDANGNPRLAKGTSTPRPRDRKSLAELRRIDVVEEGGHPVVAVGAALGVAAFRALVAEIRDTNFRSQTVLAWCSTGNFTLEPFAIAATTLAGIRADAGSARCGATARLLGGDDPIFAEPRFKRLMRSRNDWPDLLAQARRIGAILQKEAPVGDLGASLVLWNADPSIRTRWAFNYYQGELEPESNTAPLPPSDASSAPSP